MTGVKGNKEFEFSFEFRKICRKEVWELLDFLENSISSLQEMSKHSTIVWQPEQPSPWHYHNHYVDLLLAVYVAKHAAYTENLINSLNRFDYLGYALNARAIIESTSTLWFYLNVKYPPVFQEGAVNFEDLLKLDDQHLRGTRFDWERFILKEYKEMAHEVIQRITAKNKKKKLEESIQRIQNLQVNVLTCIEKWALKTPVIMILYELLCEMIHPNLGSTFLVASIQDGNLSFGRFRGIPAAHNLFETTIGWLLPIGYKEFSKLIAALVFTKYDLNKLEDMR